MNNRITHFEIQAENPERAMQFYKSAFDREFQEWLNPAGSPDHGSDLGGEQKYWMIMTAPKDSKDPGINGGLLQRPCPSPALEQGTNAYTCTVQVDDFDGIAKKIMAAGGKVAMPKFAFPGMAWQGYFIDTENNVFGLHQTDKNAK